MADRLIVIGHVSNDHVENVHGAREQPGGAALYTTIAARVLLNDVTLVSAIGRDYRYHDLLDEIGRAHVRVLNMPSTRFAISYDERWEARYPTAVYGAGSRITAASIPAGLLRPEDVLHITPMRPQKVAKIVDKARRVSPTTTISMNTWQGYLTTRRSRQRVQALAAQVDIFILNEVEAKALTRTSSLATAMRMIAAKRFIVTLGDIGAIVGGAEDETQLVPALHVPFDRIIDTTGAGDAWCGAFLAAYIRTGNLYTSLSTASIVSSIKCTGWGFERLRTLRFRVPADAIEHVIGLREGGVQKRLSDYVGRDA
jgi:ribokinase